MSETSGSAIIIVFGVSGCGKSSVAQALATRLGALYLDADEFHPEENVRKMAAGNPLTDADRRPWLERLNAELRRRRAQGESVVLACSALRQRYRDVLSHGLARDVTWVHLEGDYATIDERLRARVGHFMGPALLRSQFDCLEPQAGAVIGDIRLPLEELVRNLSAKLETRQG